MRAIPVLLMAMVLAVLTAGVSFAETIYVGDRLVVGVREIPDNTAPSIGTLKSDDGVELLEEGDLFFRVRTEDGTEGYIKKQYLTKTRPKVLVIADLEKQLARQKKAVADLKASMSSSESDLQKDQTELKNSIEEFKQQLSEKEKQLAASDKQLAAANKELAAARKDYETLEKNSADVVNIVKAREGLQKENDRLTDELNTIREDNVYLLTTFYIKWFLAGAGVMLIGWMIGKSSRRKRRY
jgi:SH3 domain protein